MDKARKDDAQKARWDLMPFVALQQVAEIFTFGAQKYGDRNWELGDRAFADRCLAAAYRHLQRHMVGEVIDADSGRAHLAHAACNLLMVMQILEKEARHE